MSDNFPFDKFIKSNNNNNLDNSKEDISKFFKTDSNVAIVEKVQQKQDVSVDSDELFTITNEILSIVKNNIPSEKFSTYFSNTFVLSSFNENDFHFSVTTKFIKMMIENHYINYINQAVIELMGKPFNININLLDNIDSQHSHPSSPANTILENTINDTQKMDVQKTTSVKNMSFKIDTSFAASKEDIADVVRSSEIKHLNGNVFGRIDKTKTFDNFVVGPSNNMAHAFSLAVSKDPGSAYPQLYLYGNSGLGKTHLLHAICNYINEKSPEKRICFTSAGDFTKEMVMSIQSKTISEFQRKYTDLVDVLIIDDIHELKDRARTQAEFFHIFNELQNKKKQLIFTSDKAPKDINGLEDRIRTRLSSALLTDIQQPDLETRIAILKNKANERDIYIGDDVINLIASCVRNNVRELEGKLIKLGAYSDLMNVDIDLEIAKEQLNLSEDNQDKLLTVESIAKTVSSYYKLPLGDIRGKNRKAELVLARHISMYLIHKLLKKTLEEIGEYFNKRDHSTVIHAIDKMKKRISDEASFSQLIYEIESNV
jgi:chromosomal replication initiator protein